MKNENKIYETKRAIEIQNSIRQVLFHDWDPIGINDNLNLTDEYDAYIAPIYRILVGSRSEEEIMNLLFSAEDSTFGELQNPNDRLRTITKKLLMLNVKI